MGYGEEGTACAKPARQQSGLRSGQSCVKRHLLAEPAAKCSLGSDLEIHTCKGRGVRRSPLGASQTQA